MPTISSAGVGSGLDVAGLVNQIVAAERTPVANRLSRQERSVNLELSAFGELKGVLSALNDKLAALTEPRVLEGRSATVQDESYFTATAESGAGIGSYDIEVQQLAESHRLATATPVNPPDSAVGYGTLTVQLGADSFDVTIDSGAQTLADIRSAINNAADNPGVVASIVNTDNGAVLQLSSDRSGADSQIQLSAAGGDGGLNTLIADFAQTEGFQDALIQINGNPVTSSSNTVTGAIEGVTISLLQTNTPGETFNLDVTRDNSAAVEDFQAFVDAYNEYVDKVQTFTQFNAESGTAGALNGDALLRGLSNQVRVALSDSYGGGATTALSQLGISLDVEGKMSLDEDQLNTALAQDFNGVSSFLADAGGFAESLDTLINSYIETDGMLSLRVEGLNDRLERISDQRDALDLRMEQVEARYLKQFTALDSMLAQMQQLSGYLSQQLASLPTAQ